MDGKLFVQKRIREFEIVNFVQACLIATGSRIQERSIGSRCRYPESIGLIESEVSASCARRYGKHHRNGGGSLQSHGCGDPGILVSGSAAVNPPFSGRQRNRRHVYFRFVVDAVAVSCVNRVDGIRAREHGFRSGLRTPLVADPISKSGRGAVGTIHDKSVGWRSDCVALGFGHARYEHALRRARHVERRRGVGRSRSDSNPSGRYPDGTG